MCFVRTARTENQSEKVFVVQKETGPMPFEMDLFLRRAAFCTKWRISPIIVKLNYVEINSYPKQNFCLHRCCILPIMKAHQRKIRIIAF